MLAAAVLSVGLQVVIFPPIDWWPLAFVCFVPWLILCGDVDHPRRVYVVSYLMGLAFFGISMRWLYLVTIPGAIVLFGAMALIYPLVACPIRHIIRRRNLPLAATFPAIWVGCEALRSLIVPRFPWNLLGHSQHGVLTLIQVSDLTGAYGVSFVVAAINGLAADLIYARYGRPRTGQLEMRFPSARPAMVIGGAILLASILYGQVQLRRGTMTDGPRVAVIQGNYPNYVDLEPNLKLPTFKQRADRYFELFRQAAESDPDLYLLPETPWIMHLNREAQENPPRYWFRDAYTSRECYEWFHEAAKSTGAYVVVGSASWEPTPLDVLAPERRYNSSFVFSPEGGEPGRYDKIHLVLIGEYAPFRYGPLRFAYLWINRIVPFGEDDYEYSLNAGSEYTTFTMRAKSQDGREYRFATPICYENVMPYISRRFVTGPDQRKRCDFLLNMSNDGWFPHSSELPQHLAASVFRAVENRVGVARAVNTGLSCFIDPDGRVHNVVEKDGVRVGPGVDGFRVSRIKVDSRESFYSRYGDWFAIICACLWGVFYLDYVFARIRAGSAQAEVRV